MRAEVVLLVSLTAFIPARLTVAADAGPAAPTRFTSSRPGEIVVPATVGGLGPFRFLLDTGSTHTAVTDRLATTVDAVPVAHGVREQFLENQVQAQAVVVGHPRLGAEALQEFAQGAQPVEPGEKHRGS